MKKNRINIFLIVTTILGLGAAGFLGYQAYQLKESKLYLETELSMTRENFSTSTKSLQAIIGSVKEELLKTKSERDDFELKYNQELRRMDDLSYQIQGMDSWFRLDNSSLNVYNVSGLVI